MTLPSQLAKSPLYWSLGYVVLQTGATELSVALSYSLAFLTSSFYFDLSSYPFLAHELHHPIEYIFALCSLTTISGCWILD